MPTSAFCIFFQNQVFEDTPEVQNHTNKVDFHSCESLTKKQTHDFPQGLPPAGTSTKKTNRVFLTATDHKAARLFGQQT